ncbi:unnamed protein product [Ilex paraguariensis]|uniref:Uncharacterized protein n=1 Tax=Ilex paraguariensis TaxID=185542 RepID=A0ABC8RT41_9AQUA
MLKIVNTDQSENAEQVKPTLLWSVFYIQELIMGSCESVPMPDGNLNYIDVLDEAMKLFQKMYPLEEFFPETAQSDKLEDEVELDVELYVKKGGVAASKTLTKRAKSAKDPNKPKRPANRLCFHVDGGNASGEKEFENSRSEVNDADEEGTGEEEDDYE